MALPLETISGRRPSRNKGSEQSSLLRLAVGSHENILSLRQAIEDEDEAQIGRFSAVLGVASNFNSVSGKNKNLLTPPGLWLQLKA